jgi:hypothetical protein
MKGSESDRGTFFSPRFQVEVDTKRSKSRDTAAINVERELRFQASSMRVDHERSGGKRHLGYPVYGDTFGGKVLEGVIHSVGKQPPYSVR